MTEYAAPVEVRMSGGLLVGEVAYNVRALDRPEAFAPGAFTSRDDPLNLSLQHDRDRRPAATTEDGSRTVTDTDRTLRLEARLREGSAERSLAERGALRGLSVEFEDRQDGLRIIRQAHLHGIGLVDSGSYPFHRRNARPVRWAVPRFVVQSFGEDGPPDAVQMPRGRIATRCFSNPARLMMLGSPAMC